MKIETELKVLKALSKILPDVEEPSNEKVKDLKEDVGLLDPALVCLIVAKSETAKRLLLRFKDVDSDWNKIPILNYSEQDKYALKGCLYSTEYMIPILNIFKAKDSNPRHFMATDYPITIEDDDFKIVLAPRVEDRK